MNKIYLLYAVVLIILLVVLESVVNLNYVTKQLIRIPLMIGIPVWLLIRNKSTLLNNFKVQQMSFSDIRISIYAGLVVYVGAIGGYALIYLVSTPSSITNSLLAAGITPSNIIWVSLYMSTINVLLEEFFFRGFVYWNVRKTNDILAYVVSSFLFALFHIAILWSYFDWLFFVLLLIGLMIVGAFLIFINRNGKSLVNSSIVHVFADVAMFSIGFYLFLS